MPTHICGIRLSSKKAVLVLTLSRVLQAGESIPVSVCIADIDTADELFLLGTRTLDDTTVAADLECFIQDTSSGLALSYSESGFARIQVRRSGTDTSANDFILSAHIILDKDGTTEWESPFQEIPRDGTVSWIVGK